MKCLQAIFTDGKLSSFWKSSIYTIVYTLRIISNKVSSMIPSASSNHYFQTMFVLFYDFEKCGGTYGHKRALLGRWDQFVLNFRSGPGRFSKVHMNRGFPRYPPYNVTVRKGAKNVAITRDFGKYVLENEFAILLYNFLQNTRIPDEHFYSTLITLDHDSSGVRNTIAEILYTVSLAVYFN